MRIIEFSDSFLPIMDGVGNVVYKYAYNLAMKGHECYVVCPQTNTGYRGSHPFEIVDYLSVPLAQMKSWQVGAPLLDIHCQNRLNMIDPDIVHVHSPFVAGQAALAYTRKEKLPLVGTFHSRYYEDFLQITHMELLAEVGTKAIVSFYNKCDEVWTVSESAAEELHSHGYKKNIRIMPNGTDIPAEPSEELKESIREHYGLQKDIPVFLYVGQMNWKKNLKLILDAASGIQGDFRLIMAGQGPNEKEISDYIEETGLSEKVVLTGHLTDREILNALYSVSDLFLFPSLYDTAGLVVREAASLGVPSVVTAGSGASEGIRDGINGFLCENRPESLRDRISAVMTDRRMAETVGKEARRTLPLPWDVLIDDVLVKYDTVIRERLRKDDEKKLKRKSVTE